MAKQDIYTTVQGDTWDGIAYKVYSDCSRIVELLAANPAHCESVVFDAGVELVCPDIVVEQSNVLPEWFN